jgi:hypothetical protein
MGRQPPQGSKIFGFDPDEWSIEQFSAGHDDDVYAVGNLVATEELTRDTFDPVALDGLADLSRSRHTKPGVLAAIGHQEDREQRTPQLPSSLVGSLEVGSLSNSLDAGQTLTVEHVRLSFVGDRQFLAPLRAAALQHDASVLGRHPYAKTVGLLTPTRVRLKRALPLHVILTRLAGSRMDATRSRHG